MGSLVFDGVDDNALADSVPFSGSGGNHEFTVGVWIKPTADVAAFTFAAYDSVGGFEMHRGYRRASDDKFVASSKEGGTTSESVAGSTATSINTWYGVLTSFAQPDVSMFGTAVTARACRVDDATGNVSLAHSTVNRPAVFDTFVVGQNPANGVGLDGKIAYVFVWNRALTAAEADDWMAGTIPAQANLVDWWDLSTLPVGGTIASETGSGNVLTLTGTTFDAIDSPPVSYSGAPGGTQHFGSASLALTGTIATEGKKTAHGASESAFTASVATSGKKTAHAGASMSNVLTIASRGKKTAHGSTTVPITVTITTAGEIPAGAQVFGSASLALTFGSTTTGKKTAHGASSLPITVAGATAGKKTAKAAISAVFNFVASIVGSTFSAEAQEAEAAAARRMETLWRRMANRDRFF